MLWVASKFMHAEAKVIKFYRWRHQIEKLSFLKEIGHNIPLSRIDTCETIVGSYEGR